MNKDDFLQIDQWITVGLLLNFAKNLVVEISLCELNVKEEEIC